MSTTTKTIGVVVGRFQGMHPGHHHLIDDVLGRFTEMAVVLGSPYGHAPSAKNPLPYEIRKKVMLKRYPETKFVADLEDVPDDDAQWSANLDTLVKHHITQLAAETDHYRRTQHLPRNHIQYNVYLVGSRDSFLQSYTGKYETHLVSGLPTQCATAIREQLARADNTHIQNTNWMSGVEFANKHINMARLYPHADYEFEPTDDWMAGYIWAISNLCAPTLAHLQAILCPPKPKLTPVPPVPVTPTDKLTQWKTTHWNIHDSPPKLTHRKMPIPPNPVPVTPTQHHENFILKTDSYKLTHWKMYDPDIEHVYSYFESRKGAKYDETVFFGLQYLLQTLVDCNITLVDVDKAERFCAEHFDTSNAKLFDRNMWLHIVNNLGGKLPIRIKAVPEGSVVPVGNVLMTVENTDPLCAPLTNHLETLLTHIWYPSTVATVSRHIKKLIKRYMEISVPNDEIDSSLDFMLHDFGYRGVTCNQAAGIGGSAHLVNFRGTDTVEAIMHAKRVYGGAMAGFSVSASEHSVMTAKGKAGEYEVIESLIDRYPNGTLSLVLDSYNIYDAVTHVGEHLNEKVMARNGKLVVRPDSGHPPEVTLKIFEILDKYFQSSVNSKGYKVLNSKVGVIYGDGLDTAMIETILETLLENGWAASNIVFGMGGGLLQKVNRDTQRNAFKCSANKTADGEWHDIFKDPIDGSKKSKAGRLKLVLVDGKYQTVGIDEYPDLEDQLVTVFDNGSITRKWSFLEIRDNAAV